MEQKEQRYRAGVLQGRDVWRVEHRLPDADFAPQDANLADGRGASFDALKLNSGSFASLCTPMDRFVAEGPTQSAHAWLARIAAGDTAGAGDVEELDVQGLASEMADVDAVLEDTQETNMGSPRASSDTYSLARYYERATERKEQHVGARSWRVSKMRKRKTRGAKTE